MSHKHSSQEIKSFLLLGLLPLIVYWIVESLFGVKAGVIASFVFAIGEIAYEYKTAGKPHFITWISNALVIGMGVISLYFDNGVYFKLQPLMLEGFFGLFLIAACLLNKPITIEMMKKMQPNNPMLKLKTFENYLKWMSFRLGIVLILHGAVTGIAAIKYSTSVWIFTKGILLFVMFGLLFVFEFIYSRFYLSKKIRAEFEKISKVDKEKVSNSTGPRGPIGAL